MDQLLGPSKDPQQLRLSGHGAAPEQSVLSLAVRNERSRDGHAGHPLIIGQADTSKFPRYCNLGYGRVGVARPCEGPCLSLELLRRQISGWLGSQAWQRRREKNGKRKQNRCRPMIKGPCGGQTLLHSFSLCLQLPLNTFWTSAAPHTQAVRTLHRRTRRSPVVFAQHMHTVLPAVAPQATLGSTQHSSSGSRD